MNGYKFTVNGDEIFCREGYTDAKGILAHLNNVGALLAAMLTMADLTRIEAHGPATELEKLKKPLAHLNPAWFAVSGSDSNSEKVIAKSFATRLEGLQDNGTTDN